MSILYQIHEKIRRTCSREYLGSRATLLHECLTASRNFAIQETTQNVRERFRQNRRENCLGFNRDADPETVAEVYRDRFSPFSRVHETSNGLLTGDPCSRGTVRPGNIGEWSVFQTSGERMEATRRGTSRRVVFPTMPRIFVLPFCERIIRMRGMQNITSLDEIYGRARLYACSQMKSVDVQNIDCQWPSEPLLWQWL